MRKMLLTVSILSLSSIAFAGDMPTNDDGAPKTTAKKAKKKKVKDGETGGAGTTGNPGSPGAGDDTKGSR